MSMQNMRAHLENQQFGHYRLLRRIGGGMSEVYLAEDTRIPRQVAVKVACVEIDTYPATTQEVMRLFQREMRAVTLLDHPHILPLFDFGGAVDNHSG
jgi:serine/threonine protein kinase